MGSDDHLAGTAIGGLGDAQGVEDGLLVGFGRGGLAHVQGAPVGALEGGGDALATAEGRRNVDQLADVSSPSARSPSVLRMTCTSW